MPFDDTSVRAPVEDRVIGPAEAEFQRRFCHAIDHLKIVREGEAREELILLRRTRASLTGDELGWTKNSYYKARERVWRSGKYREEPQACLVGHMVKAAGTKLREGVAYEGGLLPPLVARVCDKYFHGQRRAVVFNDANDTNRADILNRLDDLIYRAEVAARD